MSNNTISLRSLLEKEKLNGINFLDWFHNLRIVIKQERKEYVIEEAVPNDPGPNAPRADKDKFKKHMDDMHDVGCLMLATMTPELQKQHEEMVAYEMIQNLKEIYEGQARQERYETSKALFQCKMSEGSPVGAHVIKMMGYIQTRVNNGLASCGGLVRDFIGNWFLGFAKVIGVCSVLDEKLWDMYIGCVSHGALALGWIHARSDQPGRVRKQQYLADRSCTEATLTIRTQNMPRQITSRDSLPRAERRNLKRDCRIRKKAENIQSQDLKPMHVKDYLECKFNR
ncbi:hypothetical protein GQ457_01G016510 [Hibiscus cannabinus]